MTTFGIQIGAVRDRRVDVVVQLNGRRMELTATDEVDVFLELARLALYALGDQAGCDHARLDAVGHSLQLSRTDEGATLLTLVRSAAGEPPIEIGFDVVSPSGLAMSIWRALRGPERELNVNTGGARWRHAFPAAEMEALWKAVRTTRSDASHWLLHFASVLSFFFAIGVYAFQPDCERRDGAIVINLPSFGDPSDAGPAQQTAEDLAAAALTYRKQCAAADAEACVQLGDCYRRGAGVAKDVQQAIGFYERACASDEGSGCSELGALFRAGLDVPQDDAAAFRYLQRGCDLNSGASCGGLAELHHYGIATPKDANRAKTLRRQACALQHLPSCDEAAH